MTWGSPTEGRLAVYNTISMTYVFEAYEVALLFRDLAKARSVAMNRSIIGATILAGSGAGWPLSRPMASA